jgi:hypothetical protein
MRLSNVNFYCSTATDVQIRYEQRDAPVGLPDTGTHVGERPRMDESLLLSFPDGNNLHPTLKWYGVDTTSLGRSIIPYQLSNQTRSSSSLL